MSVELRAIERDDLPGLLSWRNEPENRRYFREYRPLNWETQTRWFDSLTEDRQTQMFGITHQGDLVGACGLCNIDWLSRSAEVSLYIGEGYIDATLAPDALKQLEAYALEVMGLRRLWVEIWGFDELKRALLTQAGYTLEVTKRQAHWDNGWHDALIYAKIFDSSM